MKFQGKQTFGQSVFMVMVNGQSVALKMFGQCPRKECVIDLNFTSFISGSRYWLIWPQHPLLRAKLYNFRPFGAIFANPPPPPPPPLIWRTTPPTPTAEQASY